MFKTLFWGLFILSLIGVLIYLFSTPTATNVCAGDMLSCLEKNVQLPFFEKICQGFACLYHNVICILKQ